ncbi:unnamed protein product [Cyprideis torosa]|uniref:Uncharacterized protein n=1 Tax=Cyprideis torosa TaxID=163714 RepID=A0A7R8W5S8_9CRUS|nr:unnamed protein product [Cyprideis torosa]CAG0881762.1 unnamed protein product [Cyprideis torosa]
MKIDVLKTWISAPDIKTSRRKDDNKEGQAATSSTARLTEDTTELNEVKVKVDERNQRPSQQQTGIELPLDLPREEQSSREIQSAGPVGGPLGVPIVNPLVNSRYFWKIMGSRNDNLTRKGAIPVIYFRFFKRICSVPVTSQHPLVLAVQNSSMVDAGDTATSTAEPLTDFTSDQKLNLRGRVLPPFRVIHSDKWLADFVNATKSASNSSRNVTALKEKGTQFLLLKNVGPACALFKIIEENEQQ